MDKIRIKDLEVYANHGVFPEENQLGQKFLVSIVLYTDTREAGMQDILGKSIHYGEICHSIQDFMKKNTFKLIETVAEKLAEHLLLNTNHLKGIRVEIKKPWAPVGLPLDTVSVEITRFWNTAYIGIGSNIGDREEYLNQGITFLTKEKRIRLVQSADYLRTKPYGYLEQEDFLNGCLEISTILPPLELLDFMQAAEKEAGRERTIHWGPRTLDMDLLLYEGQVLHHKRLILPHPEMHLRQFVLKPFCQIAPYVNHPIINKRIFELQQELERREGDE